MWPAGRLNPCKWTPPYTWTICLKRLKILRPAELIAALFELEMLGLVKQLPGKNFVKVW